MAKITETEKQYLGYIDDAVISAADNVGKTRLRKYLRNWTSELVRQENGVGDIRPPKKI